MTEPRANVVRYAGNDPAPIVWQAIMQPLTPIPHFKESVPWLEHGIETLQVPAFPLGYTDIMEYVIAEDRTPI